MSKIPTILAEAMKTGDYTLLIPPFVMIGIIVIILIIIFGKD